MPVIKLNLIFTNSFSIGYFFRNKEKMGETLYSCVVYDYRCMLYNKHYIGSIARQLSCRIAEHMGISYRTNSPLSTIPNSSIYNHKSETGYIIQKSSFKIVLHNSNKHNYAQWMHFI